MNTGTVLWAVRLHTWYPETICFLVRNPSWPSVNIIYYKGSRPVLFWGWGWDKNARYVFILQAQFLTKKTVLDAILFFFFKGDFFPNWVGNYKLQEKEIPDKTFLVFKPLQYRFTKYLGRNCKCFQVHAVKRLKIKKYF